MKFNISIVDIINSKLKMRIIEFLLSHEAAMSEREIASIIKVSHMSINRIMPELSAINFVDCVRIGNTNQWNVNRKSYAYKIFSELIQSVNSMKSPLEDLKKTLLQGLSKNNIMKIVLFGSIAKGDEEEGSDIDVFILVEKSKDKDKVESEIERLSNECYDLYGNRLSVYIMTESEYNKKQNLNVIKEINKGIEIYPERKD